jgi:hypothetical protein
MLLVPGVFFHIKPAQGQSKVLVIILLHVIWPSFNDKEKGIITGEN